MEQTLLSIPRLQILVLPNTTTYADHGELNGMSPTTKSLLSSEFKIYWMGDANYEWGASSKALVALTSDPKKVCARFQKTISGLEVTLVVVCNGDLASIYHESLAEWIREGNGVRDYHGLTDYATGNKPEIDKMMGWLDINNNAAIFTNCDEGRKAAITLMQNDFGEFEQGTSVKTTKPNDAVTDWDVGARTYCQWGSKGEVVKRHDSHGLSYSVIHEDGKIACYDPSELKFDA